MQVVHWIYPMEFYFFPDITCRFYFISNLISPHFGSSFSFSLTIHRILQFWLIWEKWKASVLVRLLWVRLLCLQTQRMNVGYCTENQKSHCHEHNFSLASRNIRYDCLATLEQFMLYNKSTKLIVII